MTTQTPEQFAAAFERVVSRGGFYRAFKAEMQAAALEAEARAKSNATERPRSRTGALRGSIAGVVREGQGYMDMAVGSGSDPSRPGVPYALMQEEGGVQRPRNAKMLRIPLSAAKTAAGVDRYPTPLRVSAPDKFFLMRAKDGDLFLVDRVTEVPWYKLVYSSTIPGSHFLYRAFDATTGELDGRLAGLLEGVFAEAEAEVS